jgi:glycosyltransferase involved in cell wall biosynthesis
VVLGAAGLAAARFLNKPVISSYHTNIAAYCAYFGVPIFTRPMWAYNRLIHSQCTLTFCPSPSTASMLEKQGFQNLRIWSRGVDTKLFRPERRSKELHASWLQGRRRPEEKTILLYAGRISWEKNLRLLTQAYRGMDHECCHLVIVGQGPAFGEIQQELAGLPVTFTGYLQGEDLAATYASADIFAFPSRSETFGQVVLEAMASGLPVAGVRSEGVCDLVQDGDTGYLLDTRELSEKEEAIAYQSILEHLIVNPAVRRNMGRTTLQEAQQRSWPVAMKSLVQGYEEVIEATRPLAVA